MYWVYSALKMGEEGRYPILHVKTLKRRALAYKTYLYGSVTQFVTHFCDFAIRIHKCSLHVLTVRTYIVDYYLRSQLFSSQPSLFLSSEPKLISLSKPFLMVIVGFYT